MRAMSKFVSCLLLSFTIATTANADCIENASVCTPKQLCEVATENLGGKIIWRSDVEFEQHMKLIKEFGLDCGEVATACEVSPDKCSISDLCNVATLENNGRVEWNFNTLEHIALAKEYGLTCNVTKSIAEQNNITTNSENRKNFTKSDFAKLSFEQRKKVQFGLKKLGLYSSSVDGLWGKNTSVAITSYIQQNKFSLDKPFELYSRLRDEGLFRGYQTTQSKITTPNDIVKTASDAVNCRLDPNELFEKNLRAYDYQRKTETMLNDVREFTVANDILTMGYSKLSKKDNGQWARTIKVICEMNDNNWSPCGSIYGSVVITQRGGSFKGTLNIPYQWSTGGNTPIVNLNYTCTQ